MKGVLHLISDDLYAVERGFGWVCWDVVDEHWLYLWEGILG